MDQLIETVSIAQKMANKAALFRSLSFEHKIEYIDNLQTIATISLFEATAGVDDAGAHTLDVINEMRTLCAITCRELQDCRQSL